MTQSLDGKGAPTQAPSRIPATLHAELLGDRFFRADAVRDHHSRDESCHAPEAPDALVFPLTTEEVRAVVGACAHHRTPVISFGATRSATSAGSSVPTSSAGPRTRRAASSGGILALAAGLGRCGHERPRAKRGRANGRAG